MHPSSTTELDTDTSNHEPTRENSKSSRHLHPATPSTSPTAVSARENGDPPSQLGKPSRRSSLQLSHSKTSTLNTRNKVEKGVETSLKGVLQPVGCDSERIESDVLVGLADSTLSSLTPLDTPPPQVRPPDAYIVMLGNNLQTNPTEGEGLDNSIQVEGGGRLIEDGLLTAEVHDANNPPNLREQLGEAQYEPWRDNRYFIANNDLRRLITPKSILRQMEMETGLGSTDIQQQTALVISERAHKLFATLVCLRLDRCIYGFLEEGIDDTDLPFVRLNSCDESRRFSLCSKKTPREPIKCMMAWGRSDVREFAKTQWYMLAPVLEFTDDIEHYDFEHHCILPWIEDHECSSSGHKGGAVEGGFGSVWKIKIHPAHQRLVHGLIPAERTPTQVSSLSINELECPYIYAAVKRLHLTDEESFWSEVAMLKEFKKNPHAHLVKLLATFRWQDRYYLIFPFAESNLREYWKATPVPEFSFHNVFWVLQQCRAITSGLHVVHEQRYTHASPGNSNHDEQSRYGRHGDLKAENILWFPEGTELGRLVIADFGLTDFHKRSTRSDIPAGHITGSPSYEPPELTLHEKVSRAYDIWTLGCLYLELVTWLVAGWDALERFPDARRESMSKQPNVVDDTFFTIMGEGSPGAPPKQAILRGSVGSWIADLHEMPRCSAFIHEFLNLISKHMLLVDPGARIKIAHLNREIQNMIVKAERDPSYLIEGKPCPPRGQLDPHPSSLAALGLNENKFPGTADGTPLPRKGNL